MRSSVTRLLCLAPCPCSSQRLLRRLATGTRGKRTTRRPTLHATKPVPAPTGRVLGVKRTGPVQGSQSQDAKQGHLAEILAIQGEVDSKLKLLQRMTCLALLFGGGVTLHSLLGPPDRRIWSSLRQLRLTALLQATYPERGTQLQSLDAVGSRQLQSGSFSRSELGQHVESFGASRPFHRARLEHDKDRAQDGLLLILPAGSLLGAVTGLAGTYSFLTRARDAAPLPHMKIRGLKRVLALAVLSHAILVGAASFLTFETATRLSAAAAARKGVDDKINVGRSVESSSDGDSQTVAETVGKSKQGKPGGEGEEGVLAKVKGSVIATYSQDAFQLPGDRVYQDLRDYLEYQALAKWSMRSSPGNSSSPSSSKPQKQAAEKTQ